MSDMLSTGVSALLAYQKALGTTSHNIANANTVGYSRQRVDLVSRLGDSTSGGYIGAGVDVQTVQRVTDVLVNARLQSSNSAYSRISVYSDYAAQIDTLPRDCPRETLAQLLALNNQPALAAGAFGVNGEDGTLTYRYFGEMAGMDFPYFRNTVANFCSLAERAQAEYRKLAHVAPAAARKPMLAAQRAV